MPSVEEEHQVARLQKRRIHRFAEELVAEGHLYLRIAALGKGPLLAPRDLQRPRWHANRVRMDVRAAAALLRHARRRRRRSRVPPRNAALLGIAAAPEFLDVDLRLVGVVEAAVARAVERCQQFQEPLWRTAHLPRPHREPLWRTGGAHLPRPHRAEPGQHLRRRHRALDDHGHVCEDILFEKFGAAQRPRGDAVDLDDNFRVVARRLCIPSRLAGRQAQGPCRDQRRQQHWSAAPRKLTTR
mmetsp:Transcript_6437/g.22938  ORF Transcript_6437/g.22938 Transcript_6437/m.22938 type:complete len:242 (+) Transcript_6437:1177-1902(+)